MHLDNSVYYEMDSQTHFPLQTELQDGVLYAYYDTPYGKLYTRQINREGGMILTKIPVPYLYTTQKSIPPNVIAIYVVTALVAILALILIFMSFSKDDAWRICIMTTK